jgi:hypothetical protein
VRVEVIGAVCFVSVERPLGNGADACPDTRAVAEVVVPGLPE